MAGKFCIGRKKVEITQFVERLIVVILMHIVNEAGESVCSEDVSECEYSNGTQVVEELAASNAIFVQEFIQVFTKMIEKVW